MNCPKCDSLSKKDGKDRNGNQRFKCTECKTRFAISQEKLLGAMILKEEKALTCLNLLVEGNSIRSTERLTGVHRDTILRLLETVGEKCMWIQENLVKGLTVADVQGDEIWAYVGCKQKTANAQGVGDDARKGSVYTFTAIESTSKLMVAWHLGKRTEQDALIFLEKIYAATEPTKRFQMSTDAFRGYDHTVNEVLGTKVDYGQIIKLYKASNPDDVRYSPSECIGVKKKRICGNPIKDKISTSIVERSNLTMRMSMRRFTRLTNAFSKKFENLNYMLAIFFAYYNFCRVHKTLKVTPAMEAGLTNTIWTLKHLLVVKV